MKKRILVLVVALLVGMPFVAQIAARQGIDAAAGSSAFEPVGVSTEVASALASILAPVNDQVPIISVRASGMSDIYEVILSNEQVLYVNASGTHFIVGDLFGLEEGVLMNLSGEAKDIARSAYNDVRQKAVGDLEETSLIIYPATVEKLASVTIFTDVDCAYCRKLHAEMADYNALGIEIRYAAYPRAGQGSDSYDDIVTGWCSADPRAAMDMLMRLKFVAPVVCDHPVDVHLAVGDSIGVTGTPAIVAEDGTLIPGYVSAPELAYQLGLI